MNAALEDAPGNPLHAEVAHYDGVFRKLLSVSIFPGVMGGFLLLGIFAMRNGLPPELLSPVSVPFFIALIVLLERFHPYCRAWNVPRNDVRVDFGHLLFSAMLTPQVVMWVLGATLLPLGAVLSARFTWFHWPAHWPILAQLAFALVISEFGGYWAHRLQHTVPALWRVHALHHSAERLYWLNAGRFHPIDMAMLAGSGFAPLIFLGCPPDTLAITLLFAGMHGTFQHANIHVKLGPLNWLFSASELHRWHHSKLIQESNSNYSGHVLIWDVIFGTRFLPKDRLPPLDIGISEQMQHFPRSYMEQLKSPFTYDEIVAANAALAKPPADLPAPNPVPAKVPST